MDLWNIIILPFGLGLLGFIEPCTVGSSLLFVKYLEGKSPAGKLLETAAFTLTRALFIGSLGALAAFVGSAIVPLQRGFWILLGAAYLVLGAFYLARKEWMLMRIVGPRLPAGESARGAAALGVVFGLNIPACAAPLLGALMAASLGLGSVLRGFIAMAVFGVALSLPLLLVVLWGSAREWLDRLAGLSKRVPVWTGVVFVVLGAWSIYFGVAL
jgi:cytochrome c-type biogenesis protein